MTTPPQPPPDAAAPCAEHAHPLTQMRRLIVLSGLIGLALVAVGLVVGGWGGAALVIAVALGILAPAVVARSAAPALERLMRVATAVLLVALALVRAIPR